LYVQFEIKKLHTQSLVQHVVAEVFDENTRSQAVARIADRTASQRLWGSLDVIGHVAI